MARRRKLVVFLVVVACLAVFLAFGLYNRLMITRYTLKSEKLDTALTIVLLTDLHSCSYGEAQQELIAAIDEQNPDLVLLSGDIADDVIPDGKTVELLEGIADRYPCYYVAGNHEFWSKKIEDKKDIFRSFGVPVLEGTGDTITLKGQTIAICGVDDPAVGQDHFKRQLRAVGESVAEGQYTILLAHRPELLESYAAYDFDLVVSGHAHGGQWRVPLLLANGLLSPNQGFFPKYTTGVHSDNGTWMVVSRGLSRETTRIPRFYNRPEVVVVELEPEQ